MNRLISANNIQVIQKADNWIAALDKACQPLLDEKAITNNYIKEIVRNVYDNGTYMVLKDNFALMHAAPGIGVNKNAISLLVSKSPINFCDKQIKIMLVLAAKNNKEHILDLQKIVKIFMDDNKFEEILSGDISKIISIFGGEKI